MRLNCMYWLCALWPIALRATASTAACADRCRHVQAALAVAEHELRPKLPPDTPATLATLALACFEPLPEHRPSFALISHHMRKACNPAPLSNHDWCTLSDAAPELLFKSVGGIVRTSAAEHCQTAPM